MEVLPETLSRTPPGGPSRLWSAFADAAQPSVALRHAGACDPAGSTSRLGGVPLVPDGFVWPRTRTGKALCFLGLLNGAEVNAALGRDALPGDAVLSFFYEAQEQQGWGFDPDDGQYWRVVRADPATATAAPTPDDAVAFASLALVAERVLTVPHPSEPPLDGVPAEEGRDAFAVAGELRADRPMPHHRVFGWPDLVQNPMRLECQLASNGVYVGGPEGYRSARAAELSAGAADWLLLWQIDTDEDAGWMWGDVGTIYYWIRQPDLAAGAFDKVWLVFQCC